MSCFVSCLGGWCALRDRCPFHLQPDGHRVSERRCLPSEDGLYIRDGSYCRVSLMPAGAATVSIQPRPAQWFSPISGRRAA